MRMIGAAWVLARKDLRMYARDRAGLCLGFLVPMALVTVFGWIMTYAFGRGSGMPAVEVWIVDEDQTEQSRLLVESLYKSESLKIRPRKGANPVTRDYVRQLIVDGDAHHAIVIPKGYTSSSSIGASEPVDLLMIRDPGRSIEDQLIQIGLMQSVAAIGQSDFWKRSLFRLFQNRGMDTDRLNQLDIAMTQMQSTIEGFVRNENSPDTGSVNQEIHRPNSQEEKNEEPSATAKSANISSAFANPMTFTIEMVPMKKEDISPPARSKQVTYQRAQSISGMAVMMLLFGLTGAGSILLAEKEMGTLKRLFGLPIPRESVLLGKFCFVAIVGLVQMLVLFVYGELMFRVGMFRSPFTLAAIVITWVSAATCFGMLITTFARTAKQADGLSTISILTMAALGGCWFPLQTMSLPLPMEIVCKSMMTYWAMEGLQGMLWNSLGLFDRRLLIALGIQWCWILILGSLAVYFYRRNYCRNY